MVIAANCFFAMAQSVSNEKVEIVWQQMPVIKLSESLKSYSSNNKFLKIYDLPSQSGADIVLTGGVLPAVAIQHPEISTAPGYSQVYWVEAKTKSNKLLYYRVFNEFQDLSMGQTITAGQPIKSDMFYFSDLSRQVSYLFASFKNTNDVKLQYIKKSTLHDDINQATEFVRNAFRMLAADSVSQANQLMEKAVNIWGEALKQSNFDDKNARINKKITEAIYKNLIPTLIMLNRFEEAEKLIKKSESELGAFFGVFATSQKYLLKKRKLSYTAPIALADVEVTDQINLITSGTKLAVPRDLATIQKLLAGSWRTVSIKTKMPTPADTLQTVTKNDYWHFLPNGVVYLEHQKKDEPFPNISLSTYYWETRHTTDGKTFFVTADKKDELKSKNDRDFKAFEIIHLSLNTMLIKFENSNPDSNVSFYYYQLERIKPLL